LALETGMRRGEILGIQTVHVDRTRRALLIPEAKNGQARTIPLTKKAMAILLSNSNSSDERLFSISGNAFRLNWRRLGQRAKTADLRFHDLRHEAISRFFERGLTISEVALISGHKDARMLLRYVHPIHHNILRKLDVRK
jgi:integrase